MKDELIGAVTKLIIKGREDLEDTLVDGEQRKSFLQSAAVLNVNQAFNDLLSRITEEAQMFIVSSAQDMEAIYAHRAILIVAKSLKDQVSILAEQFENERKETEKSVVSPQDII
jgi:hypothetical protein